MLIDRFGNEVINEPEIIEEPIVETYDPNRPVRSGFEKPEMFQEGLFDAFKPKPSETQKSSSLPKTIEDVENYHGIMIDKDFKKFITENPDGGKFKYPNAKIVSKEILEFIDNEGDPSICSLNQFIDANCEYDGCIDIHDYCLYIGGWIDDKALYLATNKSSCAPEGSIIFSDVIESGYDYNDRIFAKSFKDLLKNAIFGKDIKEYSEMDLDEMSDYIQEYVITEATSRSLKEVKQYQQKQTAMFNDKNKQQLKIFLRNKLRRNGRNSLVCNIKKDVDCKTDNELAMFNILKNVCDRYQGYTKLERIDGRRKSVKSDTYTAEKMRICELFGLDGKKYGIEEEEIHDDWIYLKFNEFNNIRNIFPVNKRTYYRFIHFTRKKNLTELSPTLGSSHFNSGYANDTVFFFAIKRGAYMPDVLRRGLNYGDNAYEYIPRATDNIYLDFTDTKPTMRDSVIPVYIETKQSLPVKKIEFDREGFKESYIDENVDDDYDVYLEAKIDAADRNELDDKCFGLVYTDENGKKVRKYPLTDKNGKWDENHIRQAVRFFGHCPKEHQHQLALNILHAAHKIGLDTTKWDTVNKAAEEKDDDED